MKDKGLRDGKGKDDKNYCSCYVPKITHCRKSIYCVPELKEFRQVVEALKKNDANLGFGFFMRKHSLHKLINTWAFKSHNTVVLYLYMSCFLAASPNDKYISLMTFFFFLHRDPPAMYESWGSAELFPGSAR